MLNDKLKVMYIMRSKLDGERLFETVSDSLETVLILEGDMGTLEVDFSETKLKRFYLGDSEFSKRKVKSSSSLNSLKTVGVSDLDWYDISLCDHICTFITSYVCVAIHR